MILGQSAATAAVEAIENDVAVQNVDDARLRKRLLADGQVLDLPVEVRRVRVVITKRTSPRCVSLRSTHPTS